MAFCRNLCDKRQIWSYEAKCVHLSCFRRWVDLFAVKFYLDRVVPINHSRRQKTRDTGLPDGEDRIHLAFLHLDTITECDGQTGGQTDERTDGRTQGSAVAYTASAYKASFAERCKKECDLFNVSSKSDE